MDCYIIRHGTAVDRSSAIKEYDRYLTDEGKKNIKGVGLGLKKIGVEFDLILSSPLVRAKQTAEIIAEQTNYPLDKIKYTDYLEIGNDWKKAFDLIGQEEKVCFVGHNPMLTEMVASLICGETENNTPVKKGTVCKISLISKKILNGELKWFIPSSVFNKLI